MKPFLYRIAEVFYKEYGFQIYTCKFVFPNRRGGVFFQKYLADIAGKPVFSPKILTIQQLFESFSSYRIAENIELLVLFHELYRNISRSNESFDNFIYWGEMLLADFNNIDKYLVDVNDLFRNVNDYRLLDDDMEHLNEQQIEAIRRFWTNFMPIEGNITKKKFKDVWEVLLELYTSLRKELHSKHLSYEGMMFREVAEKANAGDLDYKNGSNADNDNYIFVGFNALTPSETSLMRFLKDEGVADYYWDYESPIIRDNRNRASKWVNTNISSFPSNNPLKISNEHDEKTKIELIGVPSGVGQAKQLTQILSSLNDSGSITDVEQSTRTAVILPDENLLMPVLYSIPEAFSQINVTMGYSLSNSSVALLIDMIAQLHHNVRTKDKDTFFYHRNVKMILSHPLVTLSANEYVESLRQHVVSYNLSLVSVNDIPAHPLLKHIFTPLASWKDVGPYLKNIFSFLYNNLTNEKLSKENTRGVVKAIDIEKEFIVQCYKTIIRLEDNLKDVEDLSLDTYFNLFKQLTNSTSIAFRGEPLSGLQIMGVLETRAIDFDNLIILSFNEGVYPVKNVSNSFIPFTLRQGFGLPTLEHQDSIYAYNFYRMISRAKRVFLIYDTRTEDMQTGEVSRYFYQLKYLYPDYFDISERVVAYNVITTEISPISVNKTNKILKKLDEFRKGGEAFLSASLINNYINCPLQFYFVAIEGLFMEEEVQETVESNVFGSIFHHVMEILYNRYKGKTVTPDIISHIYKNDELLTEALEKAFARYYFKQEDRRHPLEGQHYLVSEVLRKYVKQTLMVDNKFTPFTYLGSEYKFNRPYRVNETLEVNFKGSIDRVDMLNDTHRIIDYKTGIGTTEFKDIQMLFDSTNNNRPYQILQLFIYGLFYLLENKDAKVSPSIYYLRSVYKDFNPVIQSDKHPINDISVYMEEFKELFDELLMEIFDSSVSFHQTENQKICQWCAFRNICQR